MSTLGTKTKKVNVYGRKKTAIINVHQDNLHSAKSSPVDSPETNLATPQKRPPLVSKLSQNTVTPLSSSSEEDEPPAKAKAKPKPKPAVLAKATKEPVPRKVSKPVPVKEVPPSPSSYAPSPIRSTSEDADLPSRRANGRAPRPRRKAVGPPIREDDDLDELTFRLEKASLKTSAPSKSAQRTTDLCSLCGQSGVQSWDSFLTDLGGKVSKVGEASYSEVYSVDRPGKKGSVLKVIPLVSSAADAPEGDAPDCSSVEEVAREIEITKRIADVPGGGFVNFVKASVLEGEYPQDLLGAWDVYKAENGSDSTRPDCFTARQKYCVIELVNHGTDLETFNFNTAHGWTQALGIVCQVGDALARAESFTNFEHRDLHEGQILISIVPKTGSANHASPGQSGLEATIIDFGLSRLDIPEKVAAWSKLPEEVFEGTGDQWDVYRRMRDLTNDNWEGEHLVTNVLWLQYLVNYLFSREDLPKPKTAKGKKATVGSHANEDAYTILMQIRDALDRAVEVAFTVASGKDAHPRRGKGGSKIERAQDVVAWCRQMGWVA